MASMIVALFYWVLHSSLGVEGEVVPVKAGTRNLEWN